MRQREILKLGIWWINIVYEINNVYIIDKSNLLIFQYVILKYFKIKDGKESKKYFLFEFF